MGWLSVDGRIIVTFTPSLIQGIVLVVSGGMSSGVVLGLGVDIFSATRSTTMMLMSIMFTVNQNLLQIGQNMSTLAISMRSIEEGHEDAQRFAVKKKVHDGTCKGKVHEGYKRYKSGKGHK